MATLGALSKPKTLNDSAEAAANYYAKGISAWEKTSMNNGVKGTGDIISKFAEHAPENTHAEIMLLDAGKY